MTFLEQTRKGKNDWWRYLMGIILILFFGQIVGGIFVAMPILYAKYDDDPTTNFLGDGFNFEGIDSMYLFIALNLSFIMLFLGIYLAIRYIHKRPFLSLITPFEKINWNRIGQAFLFFVIFSGIISVGEALLYPGTFEVSLNLKRFIPFLFLVIILTPFQTSAEELLFRGYILQGMGHWIKQPVVLAILNGVIFALLHIFNPEVGGGYWLALANYFYIGFFLCLITVKDNRLELALGAHFGINFYAALVANYAQSAVKTESIFYNTQLNLGYALITLIIVSIIFYILFFGTEFDFIKKNDTDGLQIKSDG